MGATSESAPADRGGLHSCLAHPVWGPLALALSYAIAGLLGLMLAVPPGYATAVWPPSGIALAYLMIFGWQRWPGVLLGSMAVNLLNAGAPTSSTLMTAGMIGCGAAVQAVFGVLMAKVAQRNRPSLPAEQRVLWTLALGGPVACLINASVGVLTLSMAGVIPEGGFWVNWGNWWVGDTIGVLVFTPIFLIWFERDVANWRRRLTATVPLLLMFLIVVWLFIFTSQREQERVKTEFIAAAAAIGDRFLGELEHDRLLVESLAAYFDAGLPISRQQFHRYANDLLALRPGVQSLQWVRELAPQDASAFVAQMQAEGFANFQIRELVDGELRVVRAHDRTRSVITYLEPWAGNERAFGFNIRSNPTVALTLPRAIDSGRAAVSGRIRLIQETGNAYGVVLYHPLYAGGDVPATVAARRQQHVGYVSGVIRLPNLFAGPLQMTMGQDMRVRLVDEEAIDSAQALMFESASPVAGAAEGFTHSVSMQFGQRSWRLDFALPEAYLLTHRSWQAWSLLAVGLLLTALLGLLILVLTDRNERVQQLVSERTERLTAANRSLVEREGVMERLLGELRSSEHRLRQTAHDLEATNRELEQFAYVASHDLKAPLRTVSSFTQLLERRLGTELDKDATEYLKFIRNGVHSMHALTDDLLAVSRVGRAALVREEVSLTRVVAQAQEQLSADLQERKARVEVGTLPSINGDPGMLAQVFQNLLANAIKFQKHGQNPLVRISAVGERDGWHIEVQDNGIGMDSEHLERIFLIFSRLHTQEQYPGTGLGLALCRKIMHLHGGKIWASSALGKGSTFHLWLPS